MGKRQHDAAELKWAELVGVGQDILKAREKIGGSDLNFLRTGPTPPLQDPSPRMWSWPAAGLPASSPPYPRSCVVQISSTKAWSSMCREQHVIPIC